MDRHPDSEDHFAICFQVKIIEDKTFRIAIPQIQLNLFQKQSITFPFEFK